MTTLKDYRNFDSDDVKYLLDRGDELKEQIKELEKQLRSSCEKLNEAINPKFITVKEDYAFYHPETPIKKELDCPHCYMKIYLHHAPSSFDDFNEGKKLMEAKVDFIVKKLKTLTTWTNSVKDVLEYIRPYCFAYDTIIEKIDEILPACPLDKVKDD